MAWNPFGVLLEISATAGTAVRISATQFTVPINVAWETYYNGAKTNYGMEASSGGKTVVINKSGNSSSGGSGTLTGTTFSISGNSKQTKTITVTFENFNNDNGKSETKSISLSVSVPAWTSYTVSYNTNGGTGAPSAQTKWKDQSLKLSSIKPTKTGYLFLGWSTSSTATAATYSAGQTIAANVLNTSNTTLYAVWKANTYTVSYNANGEGVTGLPGNQTKNYGTVLTLPNTKPTRANYTFKGWGTSAGATTVVYSPGASYTKNESVTLYAIWELAYTKPRIKNFSITKCDENGNEDVNGTYAIIDFDWATDLEATAILVKWKLTTASTWNEQTFPASGTSGFVSMKIGGSFSSMSSYTVEVTIADSNGSMSKKLTLNSLAFTIHAKESGDGVAFGKTAELDDTADFNFKGKFRKEVYFDQNVMFGNKTGYHDGNTGVYINKAGYMHLQRAATDGNPYIGFYVDTATSADAQIICKRETNTAKEIGYDKYLYFSGADRYAFDQNVQTQKSIYIGIGSASSAYAIITKWNDNANHNLVERFSDGLTSAFGWAGSAAYATITKIRGQTCQYQNSSGTTSLSDIRLKKDFTNLDKWSAFYDSLEPIAFKMKNGRSGRYHIGFKAQQVEQALTDAGLTTQDFAGFVKTKYIADSDDPEGSKVYEEAGIKSGDDEYGLIYTEFVALNTYEIQKLRKKNNELQKQVESLEERLKAIETLLTKE